ncbi:hypothetical protein Ahia01_001243900 [Argonauta hians]
MADDINNQPSSILNASGETKQLNIKLCELASNICPTPICPASPTIPSKRLASDGESEDFSEESRLLDSCEPVAELCDVEGTTVGNYGSTESVNERLVTPVDDPPVESEEPPVRYAGQPVMNLLQLIPGIETKLYRLMKILYALLFVGTLGTVFVSHVHPALSSCLRFEAYTELQLGFFLLLLMASIPNLCHILWLSRQPTMAMKNIVYYTSSVIYMIAGGIIDLRFRVCHTRSAIFSFFVLTPTLLINFTILLLRTIVRLEISNLE